MYIYLQNYKKSENQLLNQSSESTGIFEWFETESRDDGYTRRCPEDNFPAR